MADIIAAIEGLVADITGGIADALGIASTIEGAIADSEGAVADVEGAIADSEGAIADTEGAIADAQGALLQEEYLAALPIIAAEFKGLVDILLGAGELFIGMVKSLGFLVPDMFNGIYAIGVFAVTWMLCLFKNISNVQLCILFYVIDAVGQISYLPVRIILFITYTIGFNFYPLESSFWEFIMYIDDCIFGLFGQHVAYWPKYIRENCYNCKRLSINAMAKYTAPLVNDITVKLPPIVMPAFNHIAKGGHELMHPFKY